MKWPLRCPSLTPCDLFFWGHNKDSDYVPILSTDIDELKRHISEAAVSVTADMLEREWQETGCSIDTCPVTKGTHILSL